MRYLRNFSDFILEGRRSKWDSLSSQITSQIFSQWVAEINRGKKKSEYSEQIESPKLEFDIFATLEAGGIGFEVTDRTGANSDDLLRMEDGTTTATSLGDNVSIERGAAAGTGSSKKIAKLQDSEKNISIFKLNKRTINTISLTIGLWHQIFLCPMILSS